MNECYLYTLNKERSSLCVEALHEAVNMTITSGGGILSSVKSQRARAARILRFTRYSGDIFRCGGQGQKHRCEFFLGFHVPKII